MILYLKIVINMLLSLWTVPIILRALGQSDYGLYSLIAGVVAMLTFLNDSMTLVVQRYMSVTMGTGDIKKLNQVYNASIRIHVFLGIIIVIAFEVISLFLFSNFLNIPEDRIFAAKVIFQLMIVSTFFTVIAVPFDAVLNAYENMVTFSLVSICEAFCRLSLAFILLYTNVDKLILYGIGLMCISCLGVISRYVVVKRKYRDITYTISSKPPKTLYREMCVYAGWNTFGSVAMLGKNQGIAIVFNLFNGTVINAAYGIANQINGFLSSFTSNIQKAISPQLMKSEGAKNHDMMITLTLTLVKISTIIYSFMAIPLVIEMDQIIRLWLGSNIPEYTVGFCQLTLIVQLISQLSSGVALTIDAVGRIKDYRVLLSAVLILNIPLAYVVLKIGLRPQVVFLSMIIVEFLCMMVRIYFAQKNAGFPVRRYIKECLAPLLLCISFSFIIDYIFVINFNDGIIRLLSIVCVTIFSITVLSYSFVLSPKEKDTLKIYIISLLSTKN